MNPICPSIILLPINAIFRPLHNRTALQQLVQIGEGFAHVLQVNRIIYFQSFPSLFPYSHTHGMRFTQYLNKIIQHLLDISGDFLT